MFALFLVPAAHPLLIPWVGVPSHLLWWIHVLPVAVVAFAHGSKGAAASIAASVVFVVVGERLFGAGYGAPAAWETVWSLAAAVLGTHLLVAGFALYARGTARRYQLLFDNAASAILRTDELGRVIAANPAALDFFACEWKDMKGRTFVDIPCLSHVPEPATLVHEGWSGTLTPGEGDRERVAHVSIAAVGGEDPPGYQILILDRSEEVVHDRELQRQGRLAVLGSTLAGVAHEMKNPLQVILGHAELGLDPAAPESEMRESLEVIEERAGALRGLVQELLGFSRPDAGPDEVSLAEVVERVVALQRVSHGRAVAFNERLLWHDTLVASAVRVEQILSNLISNAVDASPAGRGVVGVTLWRDGDDAVIEVADNGEGIDPELGDRIFEPFVSTKGTEQGTGLGLAICRRLALAMGGTLSARNQAEGGAVFELRLPIETAEPDAAPPETADVAASSEALVR